MTDATPCFSSVHLHSYLVLALTVAKSGEHADGNLQTEVPSAVLKPEAFTGPGTTPYFASFNVSVLCAGNGGLMYSSDMVFWAKCYTL